jgi:hypothetical protein
VSTAIYQLLLTFFVAAVVFCIELLFRVPTDALVAAVGCYCAISALIVSVHMS